MISRLERAVNAWDFSLSLLFHAVFARREVSCVVGVAGTKSVPLTADFNHNHRCCFIVINKQETGYITKLLL